MKQKTTRRTSQALFHLVLWSQGVALTDSRGDSPVCLADCCIDWPRLCLSLPPSFSLSRTRGLFPVSRAFPSFTSVSLSLSTDVCHPQRRAGFQVDIIMGSDKRTGKCLSRRCCFVVFLSGAGTLIAVLFLCLNAVRWFRTAAFRNEVYRQYLFLFEIKPSVKLEGTSWIWFLFYFFLISSRKYDNTNAALLCFF